MVFVKSFPKEIKGQTKWYEIQLSSYEEKSVEKEAREEHISMLIECMRDAREIMAKCYMLNSKATQMKIALSLFGKRCSHVAYMKDSKCREIFDKKFIQSSQRKNQKG